MFYTPWRPWENYDCRLATKNVRNDEYEKRYLTSFGPNRRCFNGKITDHDSGYYKDNNFCYLPKCHMNSSGKYELSVNFGVSWKKCKADKAKITINEFNKTGYINCPDNIQQYCSKYAGRCPNDCFLKGRCMQNGQCQCYYGFGGKDCGGRVSETEVLKNHAYNPKEKIKQEDCQNGGVYLKDLGYCLCEPGFYGLYCENTKEAVKVISCAADQTFSQEQNKCVDNCQFDQKWDGTKCVDRCTADKIWNGTKCVDRCTHADQKWDFAQSKCVNRCPADQKWVVAKNKCVNRCSVSQVWSVSKNKCLDRCKKNERWDVKTQKCVAKTPFDWILVAWSITIIVLSIGAFIQFCSHGELDFKYA